MGLLRLNCFCPASSDSWRCAKSMAARQTTAAPFFYTSPHQSTLHIVPKPRTYQHDMDDITLHVGCQTSNDKFLAFWTGRDVSLSFGSGLRKLYFYVNFRIKEYKLELPYESIWQIELRRPRGDNVKYLLIQLLELPRIFEKVMLFQNSYFKDGKDDQWIRTTDFTSPSCIGQASVLCLELPRNCELSDFSDNFAYFKENDTQFTLTSGKTFSQDMELVPIVNLPRGAELPFNILFKVNHLVQYGCLPGPKNLDRIFYQMVDPRRIDEAYIEHALEKMYYLKECCYTPVEWLRQQYIKYTTSNRSPEKPTISLDAGLVYVRRVQVTPSKV